MLRTQCENGIAGTQLEMPLVGHWTLEATRGVRKHGVASLQPEPLGIGLIDTATAQELIWVWSVQPDAKTCTRHRTLKTLNETLTGVSRQ